MAGVALAPWDGYPPNYVFTATFAIHATLTAATHRAAWVFQCPKAGDLDAFEYRIGTRVGATAIIRHSFQDLNASGWPDGSTTQWKDQDVGASNAWVIPATFNGPTRTVTQGQWLAAVVQWAPVAPPSSLQISAVDPSVAGAAGGGPYVARFVTSWAANLAVIPSCFVLRYAGGDCVLPPGFLYPATSKSTIALPTSFPAMATRFTLGYPARLVGVGIWAGFTASATRNAQIALDGEVLLDEPLGHMSRATTVRRHMFALPPRALAPDVAHILSIRPTTGGSGTITVAFIGAAAALGQSPVRVAWTPNAEGLIEQFGSWQSVTGGLPIVVPLIEIAP